MKDLYVYPAIFYDDPDGIAIEFPDLPGCLPCAHAMEDAFKNAKEALQLHLYSMEEDGVTIPVPSRAADMKPGETGTIAMIEVWMPPFREKMQNQSTHKTVIIPRWLDTLAQKENLNYSEFLQRSLKSYLGIKEVS